MKHRCLHWILIIHARPYQPEGHEQFLADLDPKAALSLDQLTKRLWHWLDTAHHAAITVRCKPPRSFAGGATSPKCADLKDQTGKLSSPGQRQTPCNRSAVDLTATWDATVESALGSGSPTFVFKQDGEKLTGDYPGALGSAKLTGTVKGEAVDFSFKVEVNGESLAVR